MSDPHAAQGGLVERYAGMHPEQFADAVVSGESSGAKEFLSCLSDDVLPGVLVRLPQSVASEILDGRSDETIVHWISSAPLSDAVQLSRRIEPQRRTRLHALLSQRRRRELDRAFLFRDGTVGALANLDFAWVRQGATVAEAIETLRSRRSPDSAPLLVLDDTDRLVGTLDAERALIRGFDAEVRDCLSPARPLLASSDLRAATAAFAAQGERWLPVVDVSRRPVGVLALAQFRRTFFETPKRDEQAFARLAGAMFELLADLPKLLLGEPHAR
ncbi:MAG: hypothetical protein OXH52_00980 [Gammaproteobacteria bacterium]|nr:hypothetical protein [Gammaproteobacteria bacterium]